MACDAAEDRWAAAVRDALKPKEETDTTRPRRGLRGPAVVSVEAGFSENLLR